MNSITQNSKNTKRYLPHDIKTKENAVKAYLNNGDIEYTCRKYHISRYSLWRWVKKYDGTKESLKDKSHKPKKKASKCTYKSRNKMDKKLCKKESKNNIV